MERSLSHQSSSMGPPRLSSRVIQSGSYDMPDLQVRMSKKIAQLTNVIQQLHTKSEDHEMDLQDMSEAYEAEIEQMLKDAASKINTFKNQLEAVRDDTRFNEAVQKMEECYSKEKEESLAAMAAYKQKTAEREIAIQNAAKKQMADLETSFQGLQKKFDCAAQELAQLKRQASEHEAGLQKQIEKAKEETQEAIQAGNHRYNSMLHDNMNKQDSLNRQIDALKLEIAGKAGEVRDLETQMSNLRTDAEESKGRQLKSWEEERNAARSQREQEERMWQDRLQESMKQAEDNRLATLAANRKLGAVQAELTETRDNLTAEVGRSEQLSTALSGIRNDLQTMTVSRDEKEEELNKQRSICDGLNQQLVDFSTRHESHLKNASEEEKKLAAQVQQLSADLQKARTAVKDTEAANTRAYQEIQKSAIALESRTSELQDAHEQIKQLQKTLLSEIEDRKADKISADAELAQQIAAKNAELQKVAQHLAAANLQCKSLEEAGKKQSADAHAAALAEAAERLSQAQEVHSKELEMLRAQCEEKIAAQMQKQKDELEDLQQAKAKELEAAAEAAEVTLKEHMHRASEELQATEASWSAMASDLQEQVTELQQRTRTLECECDEIRQKLDRADSISARKIKDAQGQYEALTAEVSGLQDENFELQRRLQKLDAEKQHLSDTVAKAQAEATQEESALRATINDLTSAREREKKEAQELLDQQRLELGAHWQCKLDRSVADALSNAESAHDESLRNQETSLQQRLLEQHEATIAQLNTSHAEELRALNASLDKAQNSALQAVEQEWKRKMLDVESRLGDQAAAELECAKKSAESELKAARDAADERLLSIEQRHAEQLAAMEQLHSEKLCEHKEQHHREVESLEAASRKAAMDASQQLLQEKKRASVEIKKLQDAQREAESLAKVAQGSLKRKLDETQEKLDSTTTARDKLSKDLAEVQAALAKKVMEMNDAMHEASQSHKQEISGLKSRHQRETEDAETTYCRRIAALKATLEDVTTEHDEKYENLSQAYGELKLAWDNRGARQQDVDRINSLQQMIDERDEQIQGFSKKYNELRNEMLLREDNYNNHFANGGMGKQVLGVDRALSSGEDVAGWMLKKNSSSLQRVSSSARPSGPRASRIE